MAKRDKEGLDEITKMRIENALRYGGPNASPEAQREVSKAIDRALAEDEKLKESRKS